MKTSKEMLKSIKRPVIKDVFGNEVYVGDIIGYTTTGSARIMPYVVTDRISQTNDNRVILKPISDNSYGQVSLDIKGLQPGSSRWGSGPMRSIVKLNDAAPSFYLDKAKEIIDAMHKHDQDLKEQRANKAKEAIATRIYFVFLRDIFSKEIWMRFEFVESQAGKALSKKDIQASLNKVYDKYKNNFDIFVSEQYGISQVTKTELIKKSLKPVMNAIKEIDRYRWNNDKLKTQIDFHNYSSVNRVGLANYNEVKKALADPQFDMNHISNNIKYQYGYHIYENCKFMTDFIFNHPLLIRVNQAHDIYTDKNNSSSYYSMNKISQARKNKNYCIPMYAIGNAKWFNLNYMFTQELMDQFEEKFF